MASPIITVLTFTRGRLSKINGVDYSDVSFSSDQDLILWEARADGSGPGQGDLVGQSGSASQTWDSLDAKAQTWDSLDAQAKKWDVFDGTIILIAGASASFRVDDEELKWGDKGYRVNIYGKNIGGEWSLYG